MVPLKIDTGLRGDGKPRRNWDPEVGHLGQVGPFTTEGFLHLGVALGLARPKKVYVF